MPVAPLNEHWANKAHVRQLLSPKVEVVLKTELMVPVNLARHPEVDTFSKVRWTATRKIVNVCRVFVSIILGYKACRFVKVS